MPLSSSSGRSGLDQLAAGLDHRGAGRIAVGRRNPRRRPGVGWRHRRPAAGRASSCGSIHSSATVARSAGVDLAWPLRSGRAITITRVSTPAACSFGNSSFSKRMQSGQPRIGDHVELGPGQVRRDPAGALRALGDLGLVLVIVCGRQRRSRSTSRQRQPPATDDGRRQNHSPTASHRLGPAQSSGALALGAR